MSRKRVSERSAEAKMSGRTFDLKVPYEVKTPKEQTGFIEKTSLYVPKNLLINGQAAFGPSNFSDQVLTTRNVVEVMKAIFKYGDVAKRYGENGLEKDPSRQQIIIYTIVVCQKHLLWYQRASINGRKKKKGKVTGDPRLQGRYSIGFGGHKTYEDIAFSREELVFLKKLLPAIDEEVGTMLGLNRGLFSEVEEEIGLQRENIKDLRVLGAFHDGRYEDPMVNIQVGWVHTGIASVLEVEPKRVDHLTFRGSEIAKAWWIPFSKVRKELGVLQKAWEKGKGPKVESWTEIMIKEFWPDYLSSIASGT